MSLSILVSSCSFAPALKWTHSATRDTQTGPAGKPAEVIISRTENRIKLSKDLPLTAPEIVIPAESLLSSITETERHIAPIAFAPPSLAEKSNAAAFKWFILAGIACFLAAGIAAYSAHWLAAIKFAVGGASFIGLGKFFESRLAWEVGGGFVIAGIIFIIAWYCKKVPSMEKVSIAAIHGSVSNAIAA